MRAPLLLPRHLMLLIVQSKIEVAALTTVQRMYYQTTFHERVKINDKAALDDYSTLEYQS
jgi:hypothetical protein